MFSRTSTRTLVLALALVTWGRTAGADERLETLTPPQTFDLYVPTSASIHGAAGAFFHTDLWASNKNYTTALPVTATFYCFAGACAGSTAGGSFSLAPRETRLFSDVVASLFGLSGAGSIVLSYQSSTEDLIVTTRTYTPGLPSPTFGTAIPALSVSDTHLRAMFVGLGNNGGNLSSGFRSNAGVFNPWAYSVHVTFTLVSAAGAVLGSTSADVAASTATQINDVFAAVGASATVTTNAALLVTSGVPVFHFVTVIDNQSGDSVFVPASEDVPATPASSLLANGGFDAGVGAWSTVGLALAWSPADALGNPASGSAVVTNTAAVASSGANWIWQCVAVQPGTVLTLSGQSFIPSTQSTTGEVTLEVYFHDAPNCSGQFLPGYIWSQTGADAQATGRWNLLQAIGTGPAGVQSVSVEIQVTKWQAGGTFTAYLDNLSLVTSQR